LGQRAREVVLHDYTVAAMQAATLALYQEVLRGPIALPAAAQEADTDEAKAQQ
jgi:hypothetical protein